MVDEPENGSSEEKEPPTKEASEDQAPTQPRSLKAEAEEGDWDDIHALHAPVMREHARPHDGFEPISVWLVFLFLAFVAWGGWYVGAYSAAFRADVIDIIPLDEQARPVDPDDEPVEEVDLMALGEQVFTNCVPCHQADGQGLVGTFPPLTQTERVLGDPRPIAALILDGIHGPLEVDGVAYDQVMPGWSQLSDQEVAAVITYIRQSFGNDAQGVDADLVAQVREATADRDEPWTDEELEDFEWEALGEHNEPEDTDEPEETEGSAPPARPDQP